MRARWNRDAYADLHRIWSFNAERNVDYADRVDDRIHDRVEGLRRMPTLGTPIQDTDLRKLSVPDIQYVIIYRVEEAAIRIARIFSTSQDWDNML